MREANKEQSVTNIPSVSIFSGRFALLSDVGVSVILAECVQFQTSIDALIPLVGRKIGKSETKRGLTVLVEL